MPLQPLVLVLLNCSANKIQFVIIATGQSLKTEDVEYVRGRAKVIAVSDSYKIAPWADVLVSHDSKWWRHHNGVPEFKGEKFCAQTAPGAKPFRIFGYDSGLNSGLYGMYKARSMGAKRIILLGFDMHGDHFFGKHPEPLTNTPAAKFDHFIKQFDLWSGCEVINCTPGSALKKFPMADLRETLPDICI